MGKITSIYLTDEEAEELKRFCSDNNCTQYSVLKTALKEVLARPAIKIEENALEIDEEEDIEAEQESNDVQEDRRKNLETLRLRRLRARIKI